MSNSRTTLNEEVAFLSFFDWKASRIPRAIGNIMAVVAVLLIHMERKSVVNPMAKRILVFLWAMDFRERMEKASFWSR